MSEGGLSSEDLLPLDEGSRSLFLEALPAGEMPFVVEEVVDGRV